MVYPFTLPLVFSLLSGIMSQCDSNNNIYIIGEFSFSNGKLKLALSNKSDHAVYLQTSISNHICLYHDGKLINDPDILFNRDDLSPTPLPPEEETYKLEKNFQLGTYLNIKESANVIDSVLYSYFLNKYSEYNKLKQLSELDKAYFKAKLSSIFLVNGNLLFLPPGGSYSYDIDYTCFKHVFGSFFIQICPEFADFRKGEIKLNLGTDKEVKILEYSLPQILIGYRKYEGKIMCNGYSFVNNRK